MMIGGDGTAQRAREQGAFVITPPSLGVGMLEFHQLDRMVEAGRMAARALLDATGGDLHSPREELVGVGTADVDADPAGDRSGVGARRQNGLIRLLAVPRGQVQSPEEDDAARLEDRTPWRRRSLRSPLVS